MKRERRKFLAFTGLTVKEVKSLVPPFSQAYRRTYESDRTVAGRRRKRRLGGGRQGQLSTLEQKLLFILVYQKADPVQVVMGQVFGRSQAAANQWSQRLWPVVQEALSALGVMPEREGRRFAQAERRQGEPPNYLIDGTERRRQRPKKPEKQALHSSGKKKIPADKHGSLVTAGSKRVGYLSPTYAGKTQDKKIADEEQLAYPRKAALHKDTGFQGYEPTVQHT